MKRAKSIKSLIGKTAGKMKPSTSSTNLLSSFSAAPQNKDAKPVSALTRTRSKQTISNHAKTRTAKQGQVQEPVDIEHRDEAKGRDELLDESRSILISTEEKLQKYINDMRIEALFVEVVEELLVQAPDNPVKFILDYIANAFPNQAEESSYAKTFARSSAIGAGIPLTGVNANHDDYVPLSSDSERDFEEDSEDENSPGLVTVKPAEGSEVPETAENANRVRKRRGGILNPMTSIRAAAKERNSKSDYRASQEILNAMQNHFVLSKFDVGVLNAVASSMESTECSQGKVLCTQGKHTETFYIVESGTVDLLVDDVVITTVCENEVIGSSVLLGSMVATETARISSETAKLLHISAQEYSRTVREATQLELNARAETLKSVSLFSTFTSSEMEKLAMAFEPMTFQQRDVLFREHQPSSRMFIILEGAAMCTQQITSSSAPKPVVLFSKGDVFGESALFSPRPRAATVTAKSKTLHCLVLDRKKFLHLFGPILPIIARDKASLKRFVADKL